MNRSGFPDPHQQEVYESCPARVLEIVAEAMTVNGVHDLGGMHGFGPVRTEDTAPFHARWERRVRAMMMGMIRQGAFTLDEMRRAIESIPPAEYLASSYFERWLTALRALLLEKRVLAPAEIEAVIAQIANDPELPWRRDNPTLPERSQEPSKPTVTPQNTPTLRFRRGDRVVARNQHPRSHTRLPRYIRGKPGIIDRVRGVYTFPDTNAYGQGEHPQAVYSVRFAARDLWGDAAAATDSVYIDLWESYLDPA